MSAYPAGKSCGPISSAVAKATSTIRSGIAAINGNTNWVTWASINLGSLGCFAKTIAASMSSRFIALTNANAADQFSATTCSCLSMQTSFADDEPFDAVQWANQVNAAFAKFAQRWVASA